MAQTGRVTPAQIGQMAAAMGLDPRAVLAVASQEGLGGGVGDQGTSFGPFQLHYGGAYPSSAPQGADASQSWAWSPQGIEYALRNIAQVAGGLQGQPAVANIVSRFERPANPSGEIQGALRAYGAPASTAAPALAQAPTPTPLAAAASGPAQEAAPPAPAFNRSAFAQGLLGAQNAKGVISQPGLLAAILAGRGT